MCKIYIPVLLMVLASACGKPCNHVSATEIIPAHSTHEDPYQGKCPSTYNDNFSYYEVRWDDGNAGCVPVESVDGPDDHLRVGDARDFCG